MIGSRNVKIEFGRKEAERGRRRKKRKGRKGTSKHGAGRTIRRQAGAEHMRGGGGGSGGGEEGKQHKEGAEGARGRTQTVGEPGMENE